MIPPNDIPERIEDEAALWVVKLERGLTPAEQDIFLEWLTADPRHGQELSRHKTNWSRLDLLADWRPEHSPRPNRDLLAPPPSKPVVWFKARRTWLVSSLAAVAAVALGFFLLPSSSPEPPEPPARIATIEQRTLDDGSVIELNRGTELSVIYSIAERRVRLARGEALFTVAKNPSRPFIVTAGGVDIRAVGTAFNVRLAASAVEVLVTEGKVAVATKPETGRSAWRGDGEANLKPESENPLNSGPGSQVSELLLIAGERTVIPLAAAAPAPQAAPVTPEQVDALLAWQPKWLDYTEAPLDSIVAEFNRRNDPIRIVIADSSLASLVVSASLRSDNIENFIRLLKGGFGVQADRAGNTITLRQARR